MYAKDKIIERIIRVDQAGEIGAQNIYNGQKIVFKILENEKEYETFSEMAKEEKVHLDFFNDEAKERNIRPTRLAPLFEAGAFVMGVGTALLGPKAAYVCTEAVEEIIEKHYNKQIDQLENIDNNLRSKIKEFRDDEVNHKNTGMKEGKNKFPILRKIINKTTIVAVFLAERS